MLGVKEEYNDALDKLETMVSTEVRCRNGHDEDGEMYRRLNKNEKLGWWSKRTKDVRDRPQKAQFAFVHVMREQSFSLWKEQKRVAAERRRTTKRAHWSVLGRRLGGEEMVYCAPVPGVSSPQNQKTFLRFVMCVEKRVPPLVMRSKLELNQTIFFDWTSMKSACVKR